MALEFVSFLLTKHAPAAAQTTMSPELKQMVPLGSLGAEVVQVPQVSPVERHNEDMTVIGWRMQSLNGTVDSLLNSATRLEQEMEREARYWEQVLAVKEKGWSLHRLPREKHTLGVRYGFAEGMRQNHLSTKRMLLIRCLAYSDFRDRGLAALRRDEDGNLSFDRGIRSKGERRLRVRILHQGQPIASNIGDRDNGAEEVSVEREILRARDSLFDEELHHELDREARNLVNQGVRCADGIVLLPYETDKQIEITLLFQEDGSFLEATSSHPVADAIVVTLRILLSHAHRQNLQNRSKMPLPLREHKPARPIYALLKPILEYLQHQSYLESMQTFIEGFGRTLAAAGFDMSIKRTRSSERHESMAFAIAPSQHSTVDDIIKTLTLPLDTTMTLLFQPEPTAIKIKAHTALQPPHFGTTFHVTIQDPTPDTPMSILPPQTQFTTLTTLENHIIDCLGLVIIQRLVSEFPKWRTISAYDKSIVRSDPKTTDKETVSVQLGKGQLILHYLRGGKQKVSTSWIWYGDQSGGTEKGLIEIFGSLAINEGGAT